jgi:uncharacterized membrane protein
MNHQRLANALVLGGAVFVALAAVQRYTHALPGSSKTFPAARERCYGIARAGANDCGTARHACAGRALHDAAADEWLSLPTGSCARIVGGVVKTSSAP